MLQRFFSRRKVGPTPVSLTNSAHWDIHGADFYRAIRALPEILTPGSVLGLADGAWSSHLRSFLDAHAAALEPDVISALPADFRRARFIRTDARTIADLAALADKHAEPEVAIHLIVLQAGSSLVEWYDLPNDPIAVSLSIDEAAVKRFAEAVGGRCEVSRSGV